jgi:hypothetical protein
MNDARHTTQGRKGKEFTASRESLVVSRLVTSRLPEKYIPCRFPEITKISEKRMPVE